MKTNCVVRERYGGFPALGPAEGLGGVHWSFGAENKARPVTGWFKRRSRAAVARMKGFRTPTARAQIV